VIMMSHCILNLGEKKNGGMMMIVIRIEIRCTTVSNREKENRVSE
jgi:hypothetical protein